MKKRFEFSFLILILLAFSTQAQQPADTGFRKEAINNLTHLYYQALGDQAGLYNGPVYDPYIPPITEGNPYFLTESFSTGSVSYNGLNYEQVPLLYDIVRDEVVVRHPTGFPIALIKEKIDSFSFSGH